MHVTTIYCLRISKILTTSTKLSFMSNIIYNQCNLHNLELATKNLNELNWNEMKHILF